ncbi:MAG: hypothetical protein HUU38_18945 [Anaerolineales bacterium]|nr:hypothetical protein [Anaerolineales bacterium]
MSTPTPVPCLTSEVEDTLTRLVAKFETTARLAPGPILRTNPEQYEENLMAMKDTRTLADVATMEECLALIRVPLLEYMDNLIESREVFKTDILGSTDYEATSQAAFLNFYLALVDLRKTEALKFGKIQPAEGRIVFEIDSEFNFDLKTYYLKNTASLVAKFVSYQIFIEKDGNKEILVDGTLETILSSETVELSWHRNREDLDRGIQMEDVQFEIIEVYISTGE